jgi:hypothetical protein
MKDYILIKLRSGEEIIANLMSKNRNGIKVLRPMQIRQVPFMDHITGSLKAAVVMENWIGRTNENEVTIPNNWIGIKMPPSQEVIDAYEKYMIREDTPVESVKVDPPLSEKEASEFKRLEDEMSKMLSEMATNAGISPPQMEGMDKFMASMDKQDSKDTVIVNFMFPANVFKNMMEEGLIEDFLTAGLSYQDDNGDDSDEDDLEDDVDLKPKPKKKDKSIKENNIDLNEKGDEPWGNSYRDWSSNPNDYL